MKRPWRIVPLALGLLAAPLAAEAQQPGKTYRIGYLMSQSPGPGADVKAFRQRLRELGYVEGRDILIEERWAHGKFERLPELAGELVRLKPDVIVTAPDASVLAARNATGTIPIVMAISSDAVETGLVASLARPGGNITGVTVPSAEVVGKRLELLREVVPHASRIAVLWHTAPGRDPLRLRAAEVAARTLGVQLQVLEVRDETEFASAFSAMRRGGAHALLVLDSSLFYVQREQLAQLAIRSRVPSIYGLREHADAGGLMVYAVYLPDLWRRAAEFVDKILKGRKPADLPVEQPRKFDLVLNLTTAKALGLTLPQSLLVRADEVIQ